MKRRLHLVMMWNWPFVAGGVPGGAARLADAFRTTDFDPTFYLPFPTKAVPRGLRVKGGLPGFVRKLLGEERATHLARCRVERAVLRAVRREGPGAIVWVWPGVSIDFLRALKAAGAIVVREMINTHRATAQRVMREETANSGIQGSYIVSDAQRDEEIEELALVDFIVSPSIAVDESLIEAGIAEDRIIRSSFGWDPQSMAQTGRSQLPGKGLKAIFVGTVELRKGVHLALPAWRKAGIDGTLLFAGRIEPHMQPTIDRYLGDDVVFLPFTNDIASVYHAADFMFFPTLEEGAPLVCYEAAGCGLPVITTRMGSARIIEDGVSGLIVDAHDEDGMVVALRRMAGDANLRAKLGAGAKAKADRATWAHAAQERAKLITERLKLG